LKQLERYSLNQRNNFVALDLTIGEVKFIIFLKNKQYSRRIKEKHRLKNEQLVKFSHFSDLIKKTPNKVYHFVRSFV
ncbi:hypothetical protein, partial [Streptococcus infantis]|uniref:hypothetical protein n=1 Tax=Streptococcus infantis TaxID=68892 RepID=UPI001CC160E7